MTCTDYQRAALRMRNSITVHVGMKRLQLLKGGKGLVVVTMDLLSWVTVQQHVNSLQTGAVHFQPALVNIYRYCCVCLTNDVKLVLQPVLICLVLTMVLL